MEYRTYNLSCDGCTNSKEWDIEALRNIGRESLIHNSGYTSEGSNSVLGGPNHYCPECNDREKETFYVVDGRGEEYLGTVEAWGRSHARRTARDVFDKRMVMECPTTKDAMKALQ